MRIGFLVPPGNPTVEVEMIALAPPRVSVHFTRMVAHGAAGSHQGQEERNRSQIAHLDENVRLLAMVARHGTEQWLVMYAYGERRGLLGNGPRAWTWAIMDGLLGRPNDYYKLYLMTRSDQGVGQVGE